MTTRIKASDEEGRMVDPFLSFLVWTPLGADVVDVLLIKWGGRYVEGNHTLLECSYIEFENDADATAFTMRWNGVGA